MADNQPRNGILESAVRQAMEKLAERGVEGCSTKEVILASFGSLSMNGGLASSAELNRFMSEVRKFGWKVVSACISALVAIIITLILL